MSQFKDISNRTFYKLTAVRYEGNGKWLCKCECGREIQVKGYRLRNGYAKSCGCSKSKLWLEIKTKHGEARNSEKTRLYNIWRNMNKRCYKQYSTYFGYYGGRGIKVCDDWKNSYESFKGWAVTNGYKKNLSIDRINNDGNYEPDNCRWATSKQQANNKRPYSSIRQFSR